MNDLLEQVTVVIEGEIAEFNISQNRFVWFTLSDDETSIKCFMMMFQLRQPLEDGMQVRLTGSPTLFRKGQFVFRPRKVDLVGEGTLKQAYDLLKAKLEQEGIFDIHRKRQLPRFPQRIGLVTSSDAAAYTDFLRILGNRWSGIEVRHIPVQVQGQRAETTIVAALHQLNEDHKDLDAIVLTRGGGSMEDLHAFNDEEVVRAIFASQIPVICGVGHERDITLADLVADVRASTPSNAAELLVPNKEDVIAEIQYLSERMEVELRQKLRSQQDRIQRALNSMEQQMRLHIEQFRQLDKRLHFAVVRFIESLHFKKQRVISMQRLLTSLHPNQLLKQGYSITRLEDGTVLTSTQQLVVGKKVHTQLAKGRIISEVQSIDK